jgi:hypothetical protein
MFEQPTDDLHRETYQPIPHPVALIFNTKFNIILIFILKFF